MTAYGIILPNGRWVDVEYGAHGAASAEAGYPGILKDGVLTVKPDFTVFDHTRPDVVARAQRWQGRVMFEWGREPTASQITTVFEVCQALGREADWERFKTAVDHGGIGVY